MSVVLRLGSIKAVFCPNCAFFCLLCSIKNSRTKAPKVIFYLLLIYLIVRVIQILCKLGFSVQNLTACLRSIELKARVREFFLDNLQPTHVASNQLNMHFRFHFEQQRSFKPTKCLFQITKLTKRLTRILSAMVLPIDFMVAFYLNYLNHEI